MSKTQQLAVSTAHAHSMNDMLQFQVPGLKERVIAERVAQDDAEFTALFNELKKFLLICSVSDAPVSMLGKKVDGVWHEFILFTKAYREFCETYLGKFVDHTPNTTSAPIRFSGAKQFILLYTERFGEIPNDLWGINSIALIEANKGLRDINQVDDDNQAEAECWDGCDHS